MSCQEAFKIEHSPNAWPPPLFVTPYSLLLTPSCHGADTLNFQAMTNSKFHFKQKTNCQRARAFSPLPIRRRQSAVLPWHSQLNSTSVRVKCLPWRTRRTYRVCPVVC